MGAIKLLQSKEIFGSGCLNAWLDEDDDRYVSKAIKSVPYPNFEKLINE